MRTYTCIFTQKRLYHKWFPRTSHEDLSTRHDLVGIGQRRLFTASAFDNFCRWLLWLIPIEAAVHRCSEHFTKNKVFH